METKPYRAVLFKSVNQTMWADSMLKKKGIARKLIPVPRQISSDCGVCLRIPGDQEEAVKNALNGIDGFVAIVPL